MINSNETYKTSLYTIFIPLGAETESNEWMLVHGYTGAIDIVNNEIAGFLRKGGNLTPQMIQENLYPFNAKSLDSLVNRGYLTSKKPSEEKDWVQKLANHLHSKNKKGAGFVFLVAYDCNFRCPYCFENGISNNGKGWSKKTFTKDSVDRAFEAMLEIEPERSKISNGIVLYGGEPLLKRNKELVEYMIHKGLDNNFKFSAITNGYELQHYQHLLSPDKINQLQITVDGPKRIHDTRRTHFEDGSSYEQIMENIEMCLKQGVFISIRVNTEVNNFENLFELKEDFMKRGFYEFKNFSVYSGLIHGEEEMSCNVVMTSGKSQEKAEKYTKAFQKLTPIDYGVYNPDAQYINFDAEDTRYTNNTIQFHYDDTGAPDSEIIRTMNRAEYMNKFKDALAKDPELKISCQDFGLQSKIKHVIGGNNLFNFVSTFCGAQTGMYILDPCGDIYACWELVGQDEYIVGSYKDKIEFDEEALAKWQGKNISKVDACSKCKYAFFCGGGCMAGALREGRGYNSPHCDGYPKLFQQIVPETYFKCMEEKEKIKNGELEKLIDNVPEQII